MIFFCSSFKVEAAALPSPSQSLLVLVLVLVLPAEPAAPRAILFRGVVRDLDNLRFVALVAPPALS